MYKLQLATIFYILKMEFDGLGRIACIFSDLFSSKVDTVNDFSTKDLNIKGGKFLWRALL